MPDTEKTDPKKESSDEKLTAEEKQSSPKTAEQKTGETAHTAEAIKQEKDFLDEISENIGESAKKIGEKATQLADTIVDKFKKGISQAFDAGAKIVENVSQAAQEYAEKYKTESEITKLNDQKDQRMTQLGQYVFKHHLAGGKFTESFFNKKATVEQFDRIDILDKAIIETGKQLDNEKK